MSQEKIVKYLQDNKDKYSKDDLIVELEKFGYQEDEIKSGIGRVYSTSQISKNSIILNMLNVMMFICILGINVFGVIGFLRWGNWQLSLSLMSSLLFMIVMNVTFFSRNKNKTLKNVMVVIGLMYMVFTFFILLFSVAGEDSYDSARVVDFMLFIISMIVNSIVAGTIILVAVVNKLGNKHIGIKLIKKYAIIGFIVISMFLGDLVIIKSATVEDIRSNISKKRNQSFKQKQADSKDMARECSQKIKNIFFLGGEFEVASRSIGKEESGFLYNCGEISAYTYYNKNGSSIRVSNVNHDKGYKTLRTKVRNKKIKGYKYKLDEGVGDYSKNEFTNEHVFRYATNNIDDPYIEYRIGIDNSVDDNDINKILNELQIIMRSSDFSVK